MMIRNYNDNDDYNNNDDDNNNNDDNNDNNKLMMVQVYFLQKVWP